MFQEGLFKRFDGHASKIASIFQIMFKRGVTDFNKILLQEIIIKFKFRIIIIWTFT